MTREIIEINEEIEKIEYIEEKIGETIYEFINTDEINMEGLGLSVISTIKSCDTQAKMDIANRMLTAITGYGIHTYIEKIKEKDESGHVWVSI